MLRQSTDSMSWWLAHSLGSHALHIHNSASLLRLGPSPLFSSVHRSAFFALPQRCGLGGETSSPLVSCCFGNSEQPGEGEGGRWEVAVRVVDTSPSNVSTLGLWKE